MKTDTRDRILAYIKEKMPVSAKDIVIFSRFSAQAVFRHLKKLIDSDKIVKIGTSPKVRYVVKNNGEQLLSNNPEANMQAYNWASSIKSEEPPA